VALAAEAYEEAATAVKDADRRAAREAAASGQRRRRRSQSFGVLIMVGDSVATPLRRQAAFSGPRFRSGGRRAGRSRGRSGRLGHIDTAIWPALMRLARPCGRDRPGGRTGRAADVATLPASPSGGNLPSARTSSGC